MNNIIDLVNSSSNIIDSAKYYWNYQYRLSREVIVPYLLRNRIEINNSTIVEVGCGEGGVLTALVEAGAKKALGTDIDPGRLNIGNKISELAQHNIEYKTHNITTDNPLENWEETADLVILRDVIEHLDNTKESLLNLKKFMKNNAFLYITFPPYHTPFGGHQHIIRKFWGRFPYIHLLPNFIFHKLISSGHPYDIAEIKRLQVIRLTVNKFIKAASEAGFEIVKSEFYLLRPVFKMKFGLPTIKLTPVSFLPLIKTFFSLEASYILKKIN
ncbi:MAG: class I SAM-dependent methyltransferase [Ignavibacteriae bacterium]|nr:class I SAM-dependent methyltransferase [Ignavibacteriota bacterium]